MSHDSIIQALETAVEETRRENKSTYHGLERARSRIGSESLVEDDDDLRGFMQHLLMVETVLTSYASSELREKMRRKISNDQELYTNFGNLDDFSRDRIDELPTKQFQSILLDYIEDLSFQECISNNNRDKVDYEGLINSVGLTRQPVEDRDESVMKMMIIEVLIEALSDPLEEVDEDIYKKLTNLFEDLKNKESWPEVYDTVDEYLIEWDKEARPIGS